MTPEPKTIAKEKWKAQQVDAGDALEPGKLQSHSLYIVSPEEPGCLRLWRKSE